MQVMQDSSSLALRIANTKKQQIQQSVHIL